MPLSTLTTKGQVTIPKDIRETLHLYTGDKVEFIISDTNEVILRPVTKKVSDVFGSLSNYKKESSITVEKMNEAIKENIKKHW
ncbi:MAG: AbrB/MazE/SpoVT family DNA-binding domain-containing protein [Gammaproteobacteria bacterium]|nr:AbrB/MazE/SpoVT family DNA-binding domain-containing protein [Gammaproteobacteria bacterium]